MAPADPPTRDIPSDDELDAILNGTLGGQDIFDTTNVQAQERTSKPQKQGANDAGLGIDEEIKVVKKRQPIPKLNEDRLLSDPGIPKLRRITKERLKFKGKGHEVCLPLSSIFAIANTLQYGDIARMLNMYQLWLDDLYPRAKFADGLAIIEKLGHTKRIQMMRKQWIDEGKPRHTAEQDMDDVEPIELDQMPQADTGQMEGVETETAPQAEDEGRASPEKTGDTAGTLFEDDPDEDELDALLAEGVGPVVPSIPTNVPNNATIEGDDPFADEMEAMAGMGW